MKKRIVSLLLAVLLVIGLVPTAAAFSDVDDAELAAKIELLSELGIINGYTDGTFRPERALTRAEFTKLVVTMLDREGDRALYAGYTIFTDVVSGHWAAGYINLAARSVEKGGLALVKGYTDGSFRPDATITYGEAVTIVLRALGFNDADVGFNWPQDYVDKAALSGLADGVNLSSGDVVGRADGARIFYNALFVETKDGSKLVDSLYGDEVDPSLLGGGKTTSVVIEFAYYSGDEVTAVDGEVVKLPADTTAYTTEKGTEGESSSFGAVRDHLSYGDRLELVYDKDGKLLHVLTRVGEDSVEVLEAGETQSEVFAALGAPLGTKIYKNGVEVGFSDLVSYDVLSYSAGGAINVSDFRLGAAYTYATPNSAAPTAITVFGSSLRLAPCAKESVSQYAPLERMTLLFAVDGRVAGAIAATNDRRVGVYTGASVQFVGGPEISMTLDGFDAGALVSVGADKDGSAVGYTVREQSTSAALDLKNGTVGAAKLAAGCVFYESAADGAAPVRIDREDILADTVAAADILHVGYDSSGQAAVIILGDVTGDRYTYGRMIMTTETRVVSRAGLSTNYIARAISVEGAGVLDADAAQTTQIPAGLADSTGVARPTYVWGGVVVGNVKSPSGGTERQVVAVKLLDESYEIGRADFVGSTAVKVDGETLPIADGVLVRLESTGVFMDAGGYENQLQLVSAARAQSDSFEVLTSEGKVRVIIVK